MSTWSLFSEDPTLLSENTNNGNASDTVPCTRVRNVRLLHGVLAWSLFCYSSTPIDNGNRNNKRVGATSVLSGINQPRVVAQNISYGSLDGFIVGNHHELATGDP